MFKKSIVLAPFWRSDCKCYKMFRPTFPYPTGYIMADRTAGMDKIEEITSLSIYVPYSCSFSRCRSKLLCNALATAMS